MEISNDDYYETMIPQNLSNSSTLKHLMMRFENDCTRLDNLCINRNIYKDLRYQQALPKNDTSTCVIVGNCPQNKVKTHMPQSCTIGDKEIKK